MFCDLVDSTGISAKLDPEEWCDTCRMWHTSRRANHDRAGHDAGHRIDHAVVINRYVGNLPPMPGVFADYPAPVVRNTDAGPELAMMRRGMPPPAQVRRPPVANIRNTASPQWRG
jgi:hypothetical protein